MKYCELLYTNLNIEPDAIQPCCDVLGIKPPRLMYSGGKFPLDEYRKVLASASAANQKDQGPCSKCPLLHDSELSEESLLIRNIAINHQRSICNAKCIYCDFWKTPSPSYTIYPTITDLFETDILHENVCFHWGGGEPTILPEFEDTSIFIFKKGKKQSVCTNAILFSQQVANLLKDDACTLNISLDCGTQNTYKIVHGVDKFSTVIKNIKSYAAYSNNPNHIGLKYILLKDNDNDAEVSNFLKICQDINCTNVMFSLNFDEVSTNTVSTRTMEMATRIKHIAAAHNITAQMFYEPYYKQLMNSYEKSRENSLFGGFRKIKNRVKRSLFA